MNKLSLDSLNKKIFLLILLSINTVFSDVVQLLIGNLVNGSPTPGGAPDQNTFAWAIKKNGMTPPERFFPGTGWQMLGYAAFFPNVGEGQLYLAQKRTFVSGVASNDPRNPANFANLFNYATSIHTERQLVIAALIDK